MVRNVHEQPPTPGSSRDDAWTQKRVRKAQWEREEEFKEKIQKEKESK